MEKYEAYNCNKMIGQTERSYLADLRGKFFDEKKEQHGQGIEHTTQIFTCNSKQSIIPLNHLNLKFLTLNSIDRQCIRI